MIIEKKLEDMGIQLPTPPMPAAAYVPVVQTGNLCFVSGQLPMQEGRVMAAGSIPGVVSVEDATKAARLCAINILAQLKAHLGNLDRVKAIVRINGYIQSDIGFYNHPKVLNGASEFLVEVFGERGKHSRVVLGAKELPMNATIEIDAIVEVE
jgi:enamine deaminase RidA (YjgF/YER057c/UK114 family)